jgi:hypothetical protein
MAEILRLEKQRDDSFYILSKYYYIDWKYTNMAPFHLSKYRASSLKVYQGSMDWKKNKDMTVFHLRKYRKGFLAKSMARMPWTKETKIWQP